MLLQTFFDDVKLLKLNKFTDHRGHFLQSYDQNIDLIIKNKIVQENISFSHKNIARGLHYQWQQPMGKLVQCINGKIVDLFLDIRVKSKYFGQINFVVLDNPESLVWIPPGFAHGFLSLEDNSIVKYMCSSLYNKEAEGAININDSSLKISQLLKVNLLEMNMSSKDLYAQTLQQYLSDPKF